MKITIVDYGVGNVKSLCNTLEILGEEACISSDPFTILKSDLLILPGVGAAMEQLEVRGLRSVLDTYVQLKKPLLGICVGMQLFFTTGYEMGTYEGLGYFEGSVRCIETDAKLPHMGWNTLKKNKDCFWTREIIPSKSYVYFVHSYMCDVSQHNVDAYTEYGGVQIPAMIRKGRLYGTQFHPEKSGLFGRNILKSILLEVRNDSFSSN